MKYYIAIIFIILISGISCKKSVNTDPATSIKPHIYMSGFYGNNAVYWKDKTVITLGSATNTTGIFLNGTDVYVCGNIGFSWQGGSVDQAVYWKNGNIVKLPNPPSYANSILVNGQDVYVAGISLINNKYVAVYWKNGVVYPLSDITHSIANEIAVSGNDIYVVGTDAQYACIWKNGEKIILDQTSGSIANSIFILGSDIYVAGSVYNEWLHKEAVYWKNSILQKLIPENQPGRMVIDTYANSIAVTESDIFISGWINNNFEILWKNGELKQLNNPAQYVNVAFNASNISLYDKKPYISLNSADYWKNDSIFNIGSGYASGIFVSEK